MYLNDMKINLLFQNFYDLYYDYNQFETSV